MSEKKIALNKRSNCGIGFETARQLAKRSIAAGFIGSKFEKNAVSQTSLGRTGQVDDIAPVAVFLASDDAK